MQVELVALGSTLKVWMEERMHRNIRTGTYSAIMVTGVSPFMDQRIKK